MLNFVDYQSLSLAIENSRNSIGHTFGVTLAILVWLELLTGHNKLVVDTLTRYFFPNEPPLLPFPTRCCGGVAHRCQRCVFAWRSLVSTRFLQQQYILVKRFPRHGASARTKYVSWLNAHQTAESEKCNAHPTCCC